MHAVCLCLKSQSLNIWRCLCEFWPLKVLRRDVLELPASIFSIKKFSSVITLWNSPTKRGPSSPIFINSTHLYRSKCSLFSIYGSLLLFIHSFFQQLLSTLPCPRPCHPESEVRMLIPCPQAVHTLGETDTITTQSKEVARGPHRTGRWGGGIKGWSLGIDDFWSCDSLTADEGHLRCRKYCF